MTCNGKEDNNDCEYKPLPSNITNFLAESMCGILDTHQPGFSWDFVPLPELLLFVERVTTKAKIDIQTAIAALILVARFKKRLPKGAHGEYGACHKIFLSALLVAAKEFMAKTQEEEQEEKEAERPYSSESDDDSHPNMHILNDSDSNSVSSFDTSHNNIILSSTPSSSSISEDDDHEILSTPNLRSGCDFIHRKIINQKLSDVSGVYTLNEVNQMEKGFINCLGNNIWVTEKDIKQYVEDNKHALGIF
jgi:hypothetical protein